MKILLNAKDVDLDQMNLFINISTLEYNQPKIFQIIFQVVFFKNLKLRNL